MEDTLEVLKEMTNNLPRVIDFDNFVNFTENNLIEYGVEGGKCFGVTLLSDKSIAVTKIFISKGSIFPINKPEVVTIVSVFEGKIEIHIGKKKKVLKVGDSLRIPDNAEFGAVALEDSWAINISIPRRTDYTLPENDK